MFPGANTASSARGATPACFTRAREANGCAKEDAPAHVNDNGIGNNNNNNNNITPNATAAPVIGRQRSDGEPDTAPRKPPGRAALGPEAVFAQARTVLEDRAAAALAKQNGGAAATTTTNTTTNTTTAAITKPQAQQQQQHLSKGNLDRSGSLNAAVPTSAKHRSARPSSAPITGRSTARSDATSYLTTWRPSNSHDRDAVDTRREYLGRESLGADATAAAAAAGVSTRRSRPASASSSTSRARPASAASGGRGGDSFRDSFSRRSSTASMQRGVNATGRRVSLSGRPSSAASSGKPPVSAKKVWEAQALQQEIDSVRSLR
jgi:hypothetical protein